MAPNEERYFWLKNKSENIIVLDFNGLHLSKEDLDLVIDREIFENMIQQ